MADRGDLVFLGFTRVLQRGSIVHNAGPRYFGYFYVDYFCSNVFAAEKAPAISAIADLLISKFLNFPESGYAKLLTPTGLR